MPLIGGPRETAGSHRSLAIGGCGGEQVEHRKARRQLIVRDVVVIPFDHDLRVLPHLGPGASVLGQQCVEAESFCLLEVLAGQSGAVDSGGRSGPRRQPLDDVATIDHGDPLLRRHCQPMFANACEGEVDALHLLSREPVVTLWRA